MILFPQVIILPFLDFYPELMIVFPTVVFMPRKVKIMYPDMSHGWQKYWGQNKLK